VPAVGGTPLGGQAGESFPHIEEHWDAIAPPDYGSWRNRLRAQGIPEAEQFARVLYAVLGGWGFFCLQQRVGEYPGFEPRQRLFPDGEEVGSSCGKERET